MDNNLLSQITINDFTFNHINWWNMPVFFFKNRNKVCLPNNLVTFSELKEKLPILIKKVNEGIIKFNTMIDDEPCSSFNIKKIPKKDINMDYIINNYGELEC